MQKKLCLIGLLLFGVVKLSADVYIGIDYGATSNDTSVSIGQEKGFLDTISETSSDTFSKNIEDTNDYRDFTIKAGVGEDGGWKGQLRFSYITYDKPIFDNSHDKLLEFGADIIKEFKIPQIPNFYPYVQAGIGFGWMDADNRELPADSNGTQSLQLSQSVTDTEPVPNPNPNPNDASVHSVNELSYSVGAGISYKMVEHLYIVGGVSYIKRKWKDETYEFQDAEGNTVTTTLSATDSGIRTYIGLNYSFYDFMGEK